MTEKGREKEIKTIMAYRKVFGSAEGQAVLSDIMNELGFMSAHMNSESSMAMQNFARKILWKCGIWREENVFLIMEKLFELPPVLPEARGEK